MTKKQLVKFSFLESLSELSLQEIVQSSPSVKSFHDKQNKQALNLLGAEESPDFHDPYSALSLFLTQHIKEEMQKHGVVKKWTHAFQEELLQSIAPKFHKEFPKYRLGVFALKKTWERLIFYTEQIEANKDAVDAHGKLNLSFFIRENLRQYFQKHPISFVHPQQLAHQIASKMGECIAVLEGTKPKVHFLTRIIASLQRHLMQGEKNIAPEPSVEPIDQLLIKLVLETSSKQPSLSMEAVEAHVYTDILAMQNKDLNFMYQKMQEEIAKALIDTPHRSFSQIVREASHALEQMVHLVSSTTHVQERIHLWAMQGDLLYHIIPHSTSPLMQMLSSQKQDSCHNTVVDQTVHALLEQMPLLEPYRAHVYTRTWMFYKHVWFTTFSQEGETSFSRFLRWHLLLLQKETKDHQVLLHQLEVVSQKILPFIPFDMKLARALLIQHNAS